MGFFPIFPSEIYLFSHQRYISFHLAIVLVAARDMIKSLQNVRHVIKNSESKLMVALKTVFDSMHFFSVGKGQVFEVPNFIAILFTKHSMVAFPARWNCHLSIQHKNDCRNHLDSQHRLSLVFYSLWHSIIMLWGIC